MDNYILRIENIIKNYENMIFRNDNIVGFGMLIGGDAKKGVVYFDDLNSTLDLLNVELLK